MKRILITGLLVFMSVCTVQGIANAEVFNFEQSCKKFASLENGGQQLERQFFLLFDYLDAEFPEKTLEEIVTTSFIIWTDNIKPEGFSNSFYDFIRTYKKQVEGMKGSKDFDSTFKTYCMTLLVSGHIPY